ncbi:hypothetical protein A1O3_01711 [Capronia epimyces CBS 606.96]|uniref:Protein BFR2 n=1 Tax=Capronia epimyces CBS 606.96 TaxID=1182542 RepID=W9ZF67_9EURO|nr:uncharacterized protein A1O3_01711 [Capronia epimyces CBS 606.96]EXJ93154.1 hypothetical protein A1O3_01711 [Capronia epimyces CBS 606.96]
MKNLREQVRGLELNKAKDFDPEDDVVPSASEAESENEGNLGQNVGREHYEAVGKSRLRKPEQPTLDAKYGGVAVSRSALDEHDDDDDEDDPFAPVEDSEEDDPFAARNGNVSGSEEGEGSDVNDDLGAIFDGDESEEIDSDEALGESDTERFKDFKFRGSKKNRLEPTSGENSQEEEEEEDTTDDSDVDMGDESDDAEDDGSSVSSATRSSPPVRGHKASHNPDREELKRLAFSSASTAGLASALSAGAMADVQKGRAVKQQRQTFDRLLDARIKLQKGVTAANDLESAVLTDEEVQHAAKHAEDAALALWSTIASIRCTLLSGAGADKVDATAAGSKANDLKRKHPHPLQATRSTPLAEIWEHAQLLEAAALPTRRQTLDKWHAKTQPVLDTAPRSKLLPTKSSATSRLTDVLDTYLATESGKLIGQSWTATSNGNSNSNTNSKSNATSTSTTTTGGTVSGRNSHHDSSTAPANATWAYDDGIFYQSLLRELIASRSANLTAGAGTGTDGPVLLPPKLHPSGSRHKKVDTKASKGRKVRYTVHEKLENFMAPEDRATWEPAARSEFFASLFGNAAARVLDEDGGDEQDAGEDNGVGTGEAEALKLFRN